MVLESEIGEFFVVISVGACVAKVKERSSPWTRSYHGVVIVSSTCISNRMLVV